MERIKELEDSIKEHWTERTRSKKEFLEQHYEDMKPGFTKKLNELIEGKKNQKSDGTQKKIQSFYLHRMLSSVYTESYEAVLGMSNADLYLDEDRCETYWYPNVVYRNIDEDMRTVETLLRKKFIRLEEFELFQLKKILLNEDWKLLQEFFLLLMKESIPMIVGSPLVLDSEVKIFAGNHMDKPELLWCTSMGNCANE